MTTLRALVSPALDGPLVGCSGVMDRTPHADHFRGIPLVTDSRNPPMRALSGNARFGIMKKTASERKENELILEFEKCVKVGPGGC